MRTIRRLSRKQSAFVPHLFACLGNASDAARRSGYSASSAPTMGSLLLSNDLVLSLIAAEIHRGRIGGEAVLRRLRSPSRPRAARLRFEMLMKHHGPPARLAGTDARPLAVVDSTELAVRDHAVKFADQLGLDGRPGTDLGTKQSASTPKATDTGSIFD